MPKLLISHPLNDSVNMKFLIKCLYIFHRDTITVTKQIQNSIIFAIKTIFSSLANLYPCLFLNINDKLSFSFSK